MNVLTDWNLRLHADVFAGLFAKLVSHRTGQRPLRAGLLGPAGLVADCWWGFIDFGVSPSACYGDAGAGQYVQKLPLSKIETSRLDILFASTALLTAETKERLSALIYAGKLGAVIDLELLTRSHSQVLSSMMSENFSTCLSVRKLATLSLAAFLAPEQGWAVEGGTYFGGSATYLAKLFQELNRSVPIVTFDTFEGIPAPHEKDGATIFEEGQFSNTSYPEVIRRFQQCGVDRIVFPVKGLVQDVASDALSKVKEICFVFLDFDHYGGTKYLLELLMPRLMPGAVIVLDDADSPGVDAAVKEVMAAHPSLLRLNSCTGFDILVNQPDLASFSQKNILIAPALTLKEPSPTSDYL